MKDLTFSVAWNADLKLYKQMSPNNFQTHIRQVPQREHCEDPIWFSVDLPYLTSQLEGRINSEVKNFISARKSLFNLLMLSLKLISRLILTMACEGFDPGLKFVSSYLFRPPLLAAIRLFLALFTFATLLFLLIWEAVVTHESSS